MTAYEKARNNSRQFKSLTSLSVEKIDILLPTFKSKWASHIEKYNLDGTPRLRKYVPKMKNNYPQLPINYSSYFTIKKFIHCKKP